MLAKNIETKLNFTDDNNHDNRSNYHGDTHTAPTFNRRYINNLATFFKLLFHIHFTGVGTGGAVAPPTI